MSLAAEHCSFSSLALDIELYSDSLHYAFPFSLESWRKARKKHVVTFTDHEGKLAIRYVAIRPQYTLTRKPVHATRRSLQRIRAIAIATIREPLDPEPQTPATFVRRPISKSRCATIRTRGDFGRDCHRRGKAQRSGVPASCGGWGVGMGA